MLRIIGVAFFLSAVPVTALTAEIPEMLSAAVSAAEQDGLRLFEASKAGAARGSAKKVAEARAKVTDFCDLRYESVIVDADGVAAVYFLATVPKRQGTAFGRHYRVEGEPVTPSSRGCLVLPPSPDNTAAQMVTHLLSGSPNEFHVFISLKTGQPLFVGTQSGLWSVVKGKVAFEKSRDAPD